MPYIKKEDKLRLANGDLPETAGELNYKITLLCIQYIQKNGLSYAKLNDVVGALEGCKLEFYRRVVQKYEEEKIKLNGDVY